MQQKNNPSIIHRPNIKYLIAEYCKKEVKYKLCSLSKTIKTDYQFRQLLGKEYIETIKKLTPVTHNGITDFASDKNRLFGDNNNSLIDTQDLLSIYARYEKAFNANHTLQFKQIADLDLLVDFICFATSAVKVNDQWQIGDKPENKNQAIKRLSYLAPSLYDLTGKPPFPLLTTALELQYGPIDSATKKQLAQTILDNYKPKINQNGEIKPYSDENGMLWHIKNVLVRDDATNPKTVNLLKEHQYVQYFSARTNNFAIISPYAHQANLVAHECLGLLNSENVKKNSTDTSFYTQTDRINFNPSSFLLFSNIDKATLRSSFLKNLSKDDTYIVKYLDNNLQIKPRDETDQQKIHFNGQMQNCKVFDQEITAFSENVSVEQARFINIMQQCLQDQQKNILEESLKQYAKKLKAELTVKNLHTIIHRQLDTITYYQEKEAVEYASKAVKFALKKILEDHLQITIADYSQLKKLFKSAFHNLDFRDQLFENQIYRQYKNEKNFSLNGYELKVKTEHSIPIVSCIENNNLVIEAMNTPFREILQKQQDDYTTFIFMENYLDVILQGCISANAQIQEEDQIMEQNPQQQDFDHIIGQNADNAQMQEMDQITS